MTATTGGGAAGGCARTTEYVRILHPKDWAALVHRHRMLQNMHPDRECHYHLHVMQPTTTMRAVPELIFVLNKLLRKGRVRCACSAAMSRMYDPIINRVSTVFLDERGARRKVRGRPGTYQGRDWFDRLMRACRIHKILFTF